MRKRPVVAFVCLCFWLSSALSATRAQASQRGKRQFNKYWRVESESPDYQVAFFGDTCEIVAPKGLTLWRKEKMKKGMAATTTAPRVSAAMTVTRRAWKTRQSGLPSCRNIPMRGTC